MANGVKSNEGFMDVGKFLDRSANVFGGRAGSAGGRYANLMNSGAEMAFGGAAKGGRGYGAMTGFQKVFGQKHGAMAMKGASAAAGYFGASDYKGGGMKRLAVGGARAIAGMAALDFANPMGVGWGD